MTKIEDVVRDKYGAVASSELSGENAGIRAVAEAFGYTPEELDAIPAAANMGLSCGNPTATANLRSGEVVVDLGSGGGIDVFLAARKVGPEGKAIGIDMTPQMIERARDNAHRMGLTNAEFYLSTIDKLPLDDNSVDCLISNCVINLVPDKSSVFREMYRVLKPGGRVAVSDIALKKPLPADLAKSVTAYIGCVAGAVPIAEYEQQLREAGFDAVRIVDSGSDLNAYSKAENQSGCCSSAMKFDAPTESECCTPAPAGSAACCIPKENAEPLKDGCCTPAPEGSSACCTLAPPGVHEVLADIISKYDVNQFAASVRVYAVKR